MGYQNNQQKRQVVGTGLVLGLIIAIALLSVPFSVAMAGDNTSKSKSTKSSKSDKKDDKKMDSGPQVIPREEVQAIQPVAPREPVQPRE